MMAHDADLIRNLCNILGEKNTYNVQGRIWIQKEDIRSGYCDLDAALQNIFHSFYFSMNFYAWTLSFF